MDTFISDIDTLHHIQRGVLNKLTYVKAAAYSDLLPDGMAGNAFNYHLTYLVKHSLIMKDKKGYTLTSLGRVVVDVMSLESTRFKLRPVSGVLLLVKHSETGERLLYKSSRQPLLGSVGLPFGKLGIGSTYQAVVERMVTRRYLDQDCLSTPVFRASFNIRYTSKGQLICHRIGELWSVDYSGEPISNETINGAGLWSSIVSSEEVLISSSGNTIEASIEID